MHCIRGCGARKLKRRNSGRLRGLYVCRLCGPVGPRPLVEAITWGVPLWVRNLIHARLVEERTGSGPRYQAIVAGMVAVARAVLPVEQPEEDEEFA